MRAVLLLAVLASTAYAEPEPRTTFVTGELRGTTVVFRARYAVNLEGAINARNTIMLPAPEDASVTRVVVVAPDGRHALKLVAAEQGAARFDAIDRVPGARRWAVLVEARGGLVEVSIAAPAAAALGFELELAVPTCFERDVRYARVPLAWKSALAPALRRSTKPACNSGDDGVWVAFPDRALANKPTGAGRVDANAGRVRAGDMHLARLELAIAGSLSEVPRDLATALLVDSSRSMSAAQLESQRELAMAYARAAGETQIQLVSYARTARALLASWTNARAARAGLDRALRALAPRNGSNLEAAIDEAARWLAGHAGARRVVVFTDAKVGRRLGARLDALAKRTPAGTLVHVVTVDEASDFVRDVEFGRALAESTGGIALRGGRRDDDKPLDATLLVRPTRIDDLAITAPGWKPFSVTCGDMLDEGASCTWWGDGAVPTGPLAVTGKIWGERFTRVVTPDASRATEIARALVNMRVLEDDTLAIVQRIARAANEGMSFYGEWGRPGGYRFGSMSMRGGSFCCGVSRVTDRVTGRTGTVPGRALPVFDLSPQFAHVVSRCGLGDAHVEATVELTDAEIVDVTVTAPPSVARCVEDEIWDTAITPPPPGRFRIDERVVLVH